MAGGLRPAGHAPSGRPCPGPGRGPRRARRPHVDGAHPGPAPAARALRGPGRPGVLAGTACATEVFAQLDPAVRVDLGGRRRRRRSPPASGSDGRRAAAVRPHRGAVGPQLPRPPVGRRHADPGLRRGRGRRRRPVPDPRHPQDHPGAAGPGEGGRPGRRRRQPPGQPVRRRPDQGQPPPLLRVPGSPRASPGRRRAGPLAGRRRRGRVRHASTRSSRPRRPVPTWSCSTT